jgi:hypothetical protein
LIGRRSPAWITKPIIDLFALWVAWAIALLGFQALANARYQPDRPDTVLDWTADYTSTGEQDEIPYLGHDFLNTQVAWDSQYYLSIASAGYDDPQVQAVQDTDGTRITLNYAFFPLYPYLMRITGAPLRLAGMHMLSAYTLAGVFISLLGTLVAMFALYDITRPALGETGGLRVAFYFLVFPTSFFFAQVYTEGLFVGLAFLALALVRRKHLMLAAVLAAFATWTRSVGVMLLVPLGLAWLEQAGFKWQRVLEGKLPSPGALRTIQGRMWLRGLAVVLLPVIGHLLWRYFFGSGFETVHSEFFGRRAFAIFESTRGWGGVILRVIGVEDAPPLTRLYFLIELALLALAVLSCMLTARRYPGIALYSLAVLFLFGTSDQTVSGSRIVLPAASIFILPGIYGRNPLFDRVWTLISILMLGLMVTLFTFDMWVA